jgi:hypothetical protein
MSENATFRLSEVAPATAGAMFVAIVAYPASYQTEGVWSTVLALLPAVAFGGLLFKFRIKRVDTDTDVQEGDSK